MATKVWGAISLLSMVLTTKCPYFGTLNEGGKSVMKRDELVGGMS